MNSEQIPYWARPKVLSWTGFGAMLLYSVVAMFLSNPDLKGGSPAIRLAVSLLGLLLLFGLLWLAHRTVLRRPDPATVQVVVPVTLVVISTVRAIAVAYLLVWTGITDSIDWAVRLPGSIIGFTTAMLICNAALGSLAEHRSRQRDLSARREAARQARDVVLAQIDEDWSRTTERIRAELMARVNRLPADDPQAASARLQETVEEVVRPISRDLADTVPTLELSAEPPRARSRTDIPALVLSATEGQPLSPGWTAILFAAFGAPFLFATLPPLEALLLMPFGMLEVWVLLRIGNLLLGKVLPRLGATGRILAILVVLLVVGTILAAPAPWIVDGPAIVVNRIMIGDVLLVAELAVILIIARAADHQRGRIEADLQESADAVSWQLARARGIQWREQRALARAMHGPVQSALAWGVVQLDTAEQDGEVDAELIGAVRSQIMAALDTLTPARKQQTTPVAALAELAATWKGVCNISWTAPDDAVEALARDPVATDCTRDLAVEACWNAMRHAHAASITVELQLLTPRLLRLTVVDDGVPEKSREPGLGTQMLTDMTITWLRERSEDRTVVEATLPVEATLDKATAVWPG